MVLPIGKQTARNAGAIFAFALDTRTRKMTCASALFNHYFYSS